MRAADGSRRPVRATPHDEYAPGVIEREMLATGGGHVPLAVTTRSGVDESVHFGSVVVVDREGSVVYSAGNAELPIYARSALKPLQAAAMLDAGLNVTDEQLALMCASHDGTDRHCEIVRSILAAAGLGEDQLQNTPALPLDAETARAVLRAGGDRTALRMNCSGKHAGMLATCVLNDWPTDTYVDPAHPLQQRIATTVGEFAGDVAHVGVDGCGAPTHVVPLAGLALAFSRVADGSSPVRAAMVAYPELVGGDRRPVSRLMQAIPGLMAKDGAEGVCAAALPQGGGIAVKIADGAHRAWPAVVLAALETAGVDTSVVPDGVSASILAHGRPAGEIRTVLPR